MAFCSFFHLPNSLYVHMKTTISPRKFHIEFQVGNNVKFLCREKQHTFAYAKPNHHNKSNHGCKQPSLCNFSWKGMER